MPRVPGRAAGKLGSLRVCALKSHEEFRTPACHATANALQRHGHAPGQVYVRFRHADPMHLAPPCLPVCSASCAER